MTDQQAEQTPADRIALLRQALVAWLERIDGGDILDVEMFTSRVGQAMLPITPPGIRNPLAPSGELSLVAFARSRALSQAGIGAIEEATKPGGGLVVPPPGANVRNLRDVRN